jgi:hypothetical protein
VVTNQLQLNERQVGLLRRLGWLRALVTDAGRFYLSTGGHWTTVGRQRAVPRPTPSVQTDALLCRWQARSSLSIEDTSVSRPPRLGLRIGKVTAIDSQSP